MIYGKNAEIKAKLNVCLNIEDKLKLQRNWPL
jgi:hypothetical protein